MKLKMLVLASSLLFSLSLVAQDPQLVENGEPQAEIVVDCTVAECCPVEFGAQELQMWLKKISGEELPIVRAATDADNVKIFIGTPKLSETIGAMAATLGDEVKKLANTDGFVIARDGKRVYIIGEIEKGALNGVYQFLHDNTDIVFVRPRESEDGFGTIYGTNATVVLKQQSVTRVPAFPRYRYFEGRDKSVHLWNTRNMCRPNVNVTVGTFRGMQNLMKTWGANPIGGQHAINITMPIRKWSAEHPEFYPFRDGKREFNLKFDTWLCWTNPEAVETLAELYAASVEKGLAQGLSQFDLPHGDTDRVCLCEECKKDIVVDGQVVAAFADTLGKNPDVPAHMSNFNSTRYYQAINGVAKAVAEKHPEVRLRGMAYWITRIAPGVKLEPNIDIVWCPYKKSLRLPMSDVRQTTDRYNYPKTFEDWCKVSTGNFYLYEYYFCTQPACAPNPVSDVLAADLKWYKEHHGMDAVYFDSNGWDNDTTFNDYGTTYSRSSTFDASAIEFYVAAQLLWDPNLDTEKLRDDFCTRAFREAAPEMRAFYRLYHDGWDQNEKFLAWDAGPTKCYIRYLVLPGNGKQAEQLLRTALDKTTHPGSKMLIRRQLDLYLKAIDF